MASFVLSFFPLDVLDGIWDLIESVSEGFITYSYTYIRNLCSQSVMLRACSNSQDSVDRGKLPISKMLCEWLIAEKNLCQVLKSSVRDTMTLMIN